MMPNIIHRGCVITFPNRQFWICYTVFLFLETCMCLGALLERYDTHSFTYWASSDTWTSPRKDPTVFQEHLFFVNWTRTSYSQPGTFTQDDISFSRGSNRQQVPYNFFFLSFSYNVDILLRIQLQCKCHGGCYVLQPKFISWTPKADWIHSKDISGHELALSPDTGSEPVAIRPGRSSMVGYERVIWLIDVLASNGHFPWIPDIS